MGSSWRWEGAWAALAKRTPSGSENEKLGDRLCLLDARNIACQGGESLEKPNLQKLIKAMKWHQENRPDWKVLIFIYEGLMEMWKANYPNDIQDLEHCMTATPRREDVDKFIIRKAVDAAKRGCHVKIVSNDNFREYIGNVEDFDFSEHWVRDHPVEPFTSLILTGRGAKTPAVLPLKEGMSEVRCPHVNLCPLRVQLQASTSELWKLRLTGYETPASRSVRPTVLKLMLSQGGILQRNMRFWCPTCSRPLELRNEGFHERNGAVEEGGRLQPRRRGKGNAFVAVLFGPELSQKYVVEELTRRSEERFRNVFTKLQVLGCDDYDKVVLLDIDLLVVDNIDELKNFKAPAALRRGHKPLPDSVDVSLSCYAGNGQQKYGMNLGVALLKPSRETLEKMLDVVKSRDRTHQATNGPEQDFLTRWYKDWSTLDLKYNYQLHQLAYSLEHVGADADRLQLKIENVKVFHYSGKVKPWDFYFGSTNPPKFSEFLEETLLPAYCVGGSTSGTRVDEDMQRKIRFAAEKWYESCEAMWQDLLCIAISSGATKGMCQLCHQKVEEKDTTLESLMEHYFVTCPEIADLHENLEAPISSNDLRAPEPADFPKVLGLVSGVLERRRWCSTWY
eukprot:symbB.v1.2.009233.t1/scaffold583.1/size184467/5